MFLRILLSFSIAFSPVLEATKYTYREIDDFEKIYTTFHETSLQKIENNNKKDTIDLLFCDLDGVIVKDHARNKGDVIPINNNSQDLFNTIKKNKGKTFGLTARNPKKAELTSQNFLKNGINFDKDIFNFTDLSINYHRVTSNFKCIIYPPHFCQDLTGSVPYWK